MVVDPHVAKLVTSIPWQAWAFVIVQTTAIIIWAVRHDTRMDNIERMVTAQERTDIADREFRMNLDRRMLLLEERQGVMAEVDRQQTRQIGDIIKMLTPAVPR